MGQDIYILTFINNKDMKEIKKEVATQNASMNANCNMAVIAGVINNNVFVANNEDFEHLYDLVKNEEINNEIYTTLKSDSRYKHIIIETCNFDSSWDSWDLVIDKIGDLYFRLNGFENTYCIALKDIVIYSTFLGRKVIDLYQLSVIYYSLYSMAYNNVI